MPNDLAGPHLEVEVGDRGARPVVVDPELGDVEHDVAGRGGRLVDGERHVAAHHQGGEALLGGLGRVGLAHHLAASEHDDAVGDGQHLAELVGDEDDRLPLLDQAADDREEVVDLARGEHGGGLVEDEDVGVAVERLDQLDALLLAHRQVADDRVGVDLEPVLGAELPDASAGATQVERQPLARLVAEDDVLGDREHRDELEVLVHHADARGDGVGGAAEARRARPARGPRPSSGW